MNQDEIIMKKCFEVAQLAGRDTFLNPLVGAILCDFEGNILSTGYHKKYGEAHAEVNCIKNHKGSFKNTILYVNLEPCSHFGKTPPCADLIIEKGIEKVVIGMIDPNPKVAGGGIEKLKNAGIEVVVGVLENEAKNINKIFLKNIQEKKPYVSTKIATTLDGKIATKNKSSKWITGEKSRKYVRKIRDAHWANSTA
jgi:diaminohydroxyphosphoribosylaminopyrimidine deaminase/5-amino-6-(5-phosphoribosylamino)uracil reductase